MTKTTFPWLTAALLSVACAGSPMRTYPGPERPASELSLLTEGTNASIWAIDGARASGSTWRLLPGVHEVWLRLRLYTNAPNVHWTIWSYCRVPIEMVAGESYSSRIRKREETAPGLSENVKLEVGIADSKSRLRGVPTDCGGELPDLLRKPTKVA